MTIYACMHFADSTDRVYTDADDHSRLTDALTHRPSHQLTISDVTHHNGCQHQQQQQQQAEDHLTDTFLTKWPTDITPLSTTHRIFQSLSGELKARTERRN